MSNTADRYCETQDRDVQFVVARHLNITGLLTANLGCLRLLWQCQELFPTCHTVKDGLLDMGVLFLSSNKGRPTVGGPLG